MKNPTACCLRCGTTDAPGFVRVLSTTESADCCALCAIVLLGGIDAGLTDVTIVIGAGAAVAR